MSPTEGLRDQKKAATRAALAAAAITLGRDIGFESVTAEAIAHHAGVSTRTFHNYFSSKEEAALFHLEEQAREWVERLNGRPTGETFWDSVRYVVLSLIDDPARSIEDAIDAAKMIESTPSLTAKKYELDGALSQAFTTEIAQRLGLDPRTDLYPRMLQSVIGAAVGSALAVWQSGDSGASSPRDWVELALRQLEVGFVKPVLSEDYSNSNL